MLYIGSVQSFNFFRILVFRITFLGSPNFWDMYTCICFTELYYQNHNIYFQFLILISCFRKMNKRFRDCGRKYLSGNKKRTKAKKQKENDLKDKGAIEKFLNKSTTNNAEEQIDIQISDENKSTTDKAEEQIDLQLSDENGSKGNLSEEVIQDNEIRDLVTEFDNNQNENVPIEDMEHQNSISLSHVELTDDPVTWSNINQNIRDYLVKKGPPAITIDVFPMNDKGRHFSKFHCKRTLQNGEVVDRPWLLYSVSSDKIFCFYCKIFKCNSKVKISSCGYDNWWNIHKILNLHENSKEHLQAMLSCCELQERLNTKKTIDDIQEKQIRCESERWYQILNRLVSTVQFLAERLLAFRGTDEHIGSPHNGNFLGVIELLAKFDPLMHDHLQKIQKKETYATYLSKDIQNEVINIIGKAVLEEIIKRVKTAKYYAIILDCTPDISHQEQMTMIIRYVADGGQPNVPLGIYEHFIKFIVVETSTGKNLCETLLNELELLGLDVLDLRGQGYDNGSNMKGHISGVQARILQINPRAFFVPCACHNYNLVLGDIAKTCPEAMTFFGTVQRTYTLCSASTKRWAILTQFVTGLTLKPLSDTRWEARIDSVMTIRYQCGSICDALDKIALTTENAQAKSEAESLVNFIRDYKFLVSLVIWYNILFQVNFVSKDLQHETMDIANGLASFQSLLKWLEAYKVNGFTNALIDAKELAEDLEVEPIFKKHRLRRKKTFFDSESIEPELDPEKEFKEQFFDKVVDKAQQSLEPRFQQLKEHYELFGFLSKFHDLSKETLRKCTADLEIALTVKKVSETNAKNPIIQSDVNGFMLCEEMEALKPIMPKKIKHPLEMLKFLACNDRYTAFPNVYIALRIYLTIPVTVASGERSFSKLKLIKNYLRSNMIQDRLSSLAIISIESEISRNLKMDTIIKDFAEKKARKVHFNIRSQQYDSSNINLK